MPAIEDQSSEEALRFDDFEIVMSAWPASNGDDGVGFRSRLAGEAPDGSRMRDDQAVPAVFRRENFWGEPETGVCRILDKLMATPNEVSEDEIVALGEDLADLALPSQRVSDDAKSVRDIFKEAYRAVAKRGEGLRLRLRIEVEELKQLPWEYMYIKGEGRDGFLALNHDISIVRTDVTEVRDYRPRSRSAVRLSLLLAGLSGDWRLNVEKDHEALTAAVDSINADLDGPGVGFVGPLDPKRPVTADDVRRLLRSKTDIFYFAGHGEIRDIEGNQETVLVLGPEKEDVLASRGFAGLLAGAEPRLAILGACDSARRDSRNPWNGMAPKLIKRAVPAVVGHQFPILSLAARDFAATVILYVLQRRTIDEAVAHARLELRTRPGVDWGIPAVYLDNGDGVLFPGEAGAFGDTQKEIAAVDGAALTKRLLARSPFRGINPYQREHRPFFFGRGIIDQRAVEALDAGTPVTVHGPAGCGKTSFLLAGIAGLRAGHLVRLSDYARPVETLREKLSADGYTAAVASSWTELVAATAPQRLVLVLDQFERVFEMEEGPGPVIEQLRGLVADAPNTIDLLIGVRDDAYGAFDEMRRQVGLNDHAVRIERLTRSEAREALVGAFQAVPPRVAVPGDLADRIVRDLDLVRSTARESIDPTELQIVGESVFKSVRERSVDPRQPLAVLEADYAGAKTIIASYLKRQLIDEFGDVASAEATLKAIAAAREDGWVRRSQLDTDLAAEKLTPTLRRLVRSGFLVRRRAEYLEYQFTGPAVREFVTDWAGDEVRRLQEGRRLLRGLAAGWNADGDEATDRHLERLEPMWDKLDPNPDEAVLLLRSAVRAHRDASKWLRLVKAGDTSEMIAPLEVGGASGEETIDSQLLGVKDGEPPGGDGYGPVAAVAASDPDPVNRKTAALAIAHRPDFAARIDAAIDAAALNRWRARLRRAEIWGTVTDADPDAAPKDSGSVQKALAWLVKVARRVRHDRRNIVRSAVVAGSGAGLLLGLQRAAITHFTRRSFDPETDWAVQLVFAFVWGFALIATLVGAMQVAASAWRRDKPAAVWKVVTAGGVAFGVAMLVVGLANGLSPTSRPMIPVMGLLCGFLMAAALHHSWSKRIRLVWAPVVAAGFGLAQWLLTATSQLNSACDAGCRYALSLPIVRSATYYGPRLGDQSATWATKSNDWFAGVAVVDAAAAGVMLFAGAALALWRIRGGGQ